MNDFPLLRKKPTKRNYSEVTFQDGLKVVTESGRGPWSGENTKRMYGRATSTLLMLNVSTYGYKRRTGRVVKPSPVKNRKG